MNRKYEGLIGYLKINFYIAVGIGGLCLVIAVSKYVNDNALSYDNLILGSAGIGFLSGGLWLLVFAAMLEFLSDIEWNTRAPESKVVDSKPEPKGWSENPYNRPHALSNDVDLRSADPHGTVEVLAEK